MPQTLRVLFLMEDLCFGGTQRQMLELARRLDRGRFTPVMLTLTGPTDLDALARQGGVELHHLGRSRRVPPLFFLRMARALRRLRPDVLVPCTALPNIWGRIWGRLAWLGRAKAPLVLGTCRGGGGPVRQHERWLWRLADELICNSQALREVLEDLGVPPVRLHYIPNGVDTEFFAPAAPPVAERGPLILCVARLAEDKDHLTLLRAFEQVLARHPQARLRLVGDGPEEARLRRWTAEHPAGARVELTPGGLDMRAHYAAARLFALASVREGQPNVLLEAMACGLPVCATAVGGVPRLVTEGTTGLLCAAGDADALAETCCRLLEDDDLCTRLGHAGRERAQRDFSFARMVADHQTLMSAADERL